MILTREISKTTHNDKYKDYPLKKNPLNVTLKKEKYIESGIRIRLKVHNQSNNNIPL